MDLGGIGMRFEKWEEEAFNYLTSLYENFFKELSEKCMDCFRIDSKELFSKNVKELTKEQEIKLKIIGKNIQMILILHTISIILIELENLMKDLYLMTYLLDI